MPLYLTLRFFIHSRQPGMAVVSVPWTRAAETHSCGGCSRYEVRAVYVRVRYVLGPFV